MTFIEPVGSEILRPEVELNRLAGTLVNGQPTLGPATAALWWLGHREHTWAPHNLASPNQATGGSAKKGTKGFVPLHDQVLEVVTGPAIIGNEFLQVTSVPQAKPKVASAPEGTTLIMDDSSLLLEDPFPVEPMHIYTCSLYTRKVQKEGETPSRANFMTMHWHDADDKLISTFTGDFHISKAEWNLTWVTTNAPEGAVSCRVTIRWEQLPGEQFDIDKVTFYNGSDPQAWAYPGAGATDLQAGLRAHLNMVAGEFDDEKFVSATEATNRMARRSVRAGVLINTELYELASALSLIPTPQRGGAQ